MYCRGRQFDDLASPKAVVKQEWAAIELSYLLKLYNSLERRLMAVVDGQGRRNKVLIWQLKSVFVSCTLFSFAGPWPAKILFLKLQLKLTKFQCQCTVDWIYIAHQYNVPNGTSLRPTSVFRRSPLRTNPNSISRNV